MGDLRLRDATLIVLALGVAVVVAVLSTPPGVVPSSAFASIALVASTLFTVRGTFYAALAAVGAAALVGGLDQGFGSRGHLEGMAVVAVAGPVAIVVARLRARVTDESVRATSAETIASLARHLGDAVTVDDVLDAMVEEGGRALRADQAWGRLTSWGRTHHAWSPATPSDEELEAATAALDDAARLGAVELRDAPGDAGGCHVLVPLAGVEGGGGAVIFVVDGPVPEDLAASVAEHAGRAIERAQLMTRRRRDAEVLQTLQRATALLNDAMTVEQVATAIVDAAVTGLGADRVVVGEVIEGNMLRLLASHGFAGDRLEPWTTFPLDLSTPLGDAVRERRRLMAASREELVRRWPFINEGTPDVSSAMIAVPLIVRNEVVGGAYLSFEEPRPFDDQELTMVSILAGRCAGALVRSRLYERERTIATALQNQLLPVLPTLPPWLRASARYLPATGVGVGGDWYQLIVVDGGPVTALVGDVVGHGISAAAAMGQLRAVAAWAVRNDPHPTAVLRTLDDFATEQPETLFATVAFASLDPVERTLTYCRAGHPPPLHVSSGRCSFLLDGAGPPLGVRMRQERTASTIPLSAGDLTVLYTDGLVERRRAPFEDRLAKLRRTTEEAAGRDIEALADHVIREMLDAETTEDDVAVLTLQSTFEGPNGID